MDRLDKALSLPIFRLQLQWHVGCAARLGASGLGVAPAHHVSVLFFRAEMLVLRHASWCPVAVLINTRLEWPLSVPGCCFGLPPFAWCFGPLLVTARGAMHARCPSRLRQPVASGLSSSGLGSPTGTC